MSSRAAGVWGWSFSILLALNAGMVSVPSGRESMSTIRVFYENNTGLIVTAQLFGLVAASLFTPFAAALQRQRGESHRTTSPWITRTGVAVTIAAGVTAVPVLWLVAVVDGADTTLVRRLARASDLSDVLLFVAIAAFAASLVHASSGVWLRISATIVLIVSLTRAAGLLTGSDVLELVAPLAFVLLVLALSTMSLVRRPVFGDPRR